LSDLAKLKGYCKPSGKHITASKGSLEEFLFERYSLFTLHNGRLCIGYVAHKSWVFKNGEFHLVTNSLTKTYNLGIKNILKLNIVHISNGVKVKKESIETLK
jgi:hypothetical protein